MTRRVTELNIGASKEIALPWVNGTRHTVVVFSGSNAGNVTVKAKVIGGDKIEDITDGTISLASRKYLMIPDIPLSTVNITYDGVAELNAEIFIVD